MRTSKTKVADLVDEIVELRQRIKKDQEQLKKLESITIPSITSEPNNFDYKDEIRALFKEKPTSTQTIDNIMEYIRSKCGFEPNRTTLSIRVGYLTDTQKELERVEGKRGLYRLKTGTTLAQESG